MMKQLLQLLAGILRILLRKKCPVQFGDLTRASPVSSCFGFDRGTPVDRYYIENFFREQGGLISGKVLEVGDSSYSRKFSQGGADSCNVLQHAALGTDADANAIIGDLTDSATLPENRFDCFICAQTFQYTFEIQKAVAGAFRLLKPGGVLLATVPGISQISRYDADRYGEYWRFTVDSVTKLFEPVFTGGVEIASFGNALSATLLLQGVPLEELPAPALLDDHDRNYPMIITIVARKAR
ncbi:MAG: methyltransferase domain-containing protein [Desulfuromonadaceae bacterium]|nr:methyltransferase domain-containing protein [Desulfuromonadaceae bacterium]